jgi:hypothetical protein
MMKEINFLRGPKERMNEEPRKAGKKTSFCFLPSCLPGFLIVLKDHKKLHVGRQ